jgi:hypothetical protein
MTRHQRHLLRRVVNELRPSSATFAAAAALYDTHFLMRLQAAERERAVNLLEERAVSAPGSTGA